MSDGKMSMLPTFLGIGVPKAGTTWLYDLLSSHPNVYVTTKIKEVRYFNVYFNKGLEWYKEFFPNSKVGGRYSALGEITPNYLYCKACPERIINEIGQAKLILILRNPVERAWSDYVFRVRIDNYRESFENFLVDYPSALNHGYYTKPIENYLKYFDHDQLMILIFEKIFQDINNTRQKLANFLSIDPDLFPERSGKEKVNRGYVPRFRSLAAIANGTLEFVLRNEQYWLINLAKRSGLKRLLSVEGENLKPMRLETRQKLQYNYEQEICDLEALLGVNLDMWRN